MLLRPILLAIATAASPLLRQFTPWCPGFTGAECILHYDACVWVSGECIQKSSTNILDWWYGVDRDDAIDGVYE